MEEIVKYTSLITLCGAAISFVIGLLKWIDQRNREREQKHYDAFHKMVLIASGVDESGKTVRMVQQIAAIYQLQEFKKYSFASLPVLELMEFEYTELAKREAEPRAHHMHKAIKSSIACLKSYENL
ncbi:hypothetical protein [Pseudoalteromonas sp. MMG012]|uniref:hypothetical protein n=1 Tax=Pseudoalteromonas sp. MMG012 TaxID=2822686 RepID=UPI001B3A472A|nr:hypothetical protein [Pseudoalteromonas sp. MMG012]MBQ4848810.1 hypothetical protein [Pseudoalteromonas sp. MMG012]